MKSIEQFTALLECGTEEAWSKTVFQLARDHGYEQTLIAIVPNRNMSLEDAFLHSNYSSEWRKIYDDAKLVHIDPIVIHCITRSTPLIWEPHVFASKQQREMYETACAYGLRAGITLPFHGTNGELGILCFANDVAPGKRFMRDALRNLPALALMRDFVFESSLRFAQPVADTIKPPSITNREMECLQWSAIGKSSWDIAQILHCSEAVVNFHFGNLRRKFDVTSRRQAVVKAIRFGLIYPS
ncbi:MAG: LuxR family transcriptional regulator [Nitrosomonadales bacterium]|nr:LuxR family transcriptional regulator [Nitrosomonadales bacterium]